MGKNSDIASMFCAPKTLSSCVLRHWNLLENRIFFPLELAQTLDHRSHVPLLDVCGRVLSLWLPGTGSQL